MSTNILPYEGKFHCFIYSLHFPLHTDSALICFVYFRGRFKLLLVFSFLNVFVFPGASSLEKENSDSKLFPKSIFGLMEICQD